MVLPNLEQKVSRNRDVGPSTSQHRTHMLSGNEVLPIRKVRSSRDFTFDAKGERLRGPSHPTPKVSIYTQQSCIFPGHVHMTERLPAGDHWRPGLRVGKGQKERRSLL